MRWYEKLFFALVAASLFYSASANAQIEGAKNLGKATGKAMEKATPATEGKKDSGNAAQTPKKSRNGFKLYKPNYKAHRTIKPKKLKKPEYKKPEYKKPTASKKSTAQ